MSKVSLNTKLIKSLKTTKSSEMYWDKSFSAGSFGVKVYKTGKKRYIIDYRNRFGQQRRFVVGDAQLIGLADARKKATELFVNISKGIDPLDDKTDHRNSLTFKQLTEEYLNRHAIPNKRPTSVKEDKRIIDKELNPKWGKLKITDITYSDIVNLLEEIAHKRKKITMAKRVRALVHFLFKFARQNRYLVDNPATDLPKFKSNPPKDRCLDIPEIKKFWQLLDNQKYFEPLPSVFKMILLTGQRPGEVCGMRWDEIDGDVWNIPAERTKNKQPHSVPLSSLAVNIIEQLKLRRDKLLARKDGRDRSHYEEFVFASRYGKGSKWLNHFCHTLVGDMSCQKFTPHDLRRTAATHLRRIGTSREVIKKILNHKDTANDVTATYDRYDNAKEKKEALSKWADEIIAITSPCNVAPFLKAA